MKWRFPHLSKEKKDCVRAHENVWLFFSSSSSSDMNITDFFPRFFLFFLIVMRANQIVLWSFIAFPTNGNKHIFLYPQTCVHNGIICPMFWDIVKSFVIVVDVVVRVCNIVHINGVSLESAAAMEKKRRKKRRISCWMAKISLFCERMKKIIKRRRKFAVIRGWWARKIW